MSSSTLEWEWSINSSCVCRCEFKVCTNIFLCVRNKNYNEIHTVSNLVVAGKMYFCARCDRLADKVTFVEIPTVFTLRFRESSDSLIGCKRSSGVWLWICTSVSRRRGSKSPNIVATMYFVVRHHSRRRCVFSSIIYPGVKTVSTFDQWKRVLSSGKWLPSSRRHCQDWYARLEPFWVPFVLKSMLLPSVDIFYVEGKSPGVTQQRKNQSSDYEKWRQCRENPRKRRH